MLEKWTTVCSDQVVAGYRQTWSMQSARWCSCTIVQDSTRIVATCCEWMQWDWRGNSHVVCWYTGLRPPLSVHNAIFENCVSLNWTFGQTLKKQVAPKQSPLGRHWGILRQIWFVSQIAPLVLVSLRQKITILVRDDTLGGYDKTLLLNTSHTWKLINQIKVQQDG